MRIYKYVYIWVSIMCMYMHTYKHMRGALSPPAVWPQGVLFFLRVSVPNLTGTAEAKYGLVDLQLPHSSDREYHMPLSELVTAIYPSQAVPSCTPTLRTYC